MLRRRIFSSAMASVMALSAVAVVANAEETTNQYKSKADLEDLLKEYDNAWRVEVLSDFGTEMTQPMINALDTAEEILKKADRAKDPTDEEDFTVAYHMVVAAREKLKNPWTLEQLLDLIDQAEETLENDGKGNVKNEELLDLEYTPASYYALETALENAKYYQNSTHPADICDAAEKLSQALEKLTPMPVVSKSQFRTKLAEYNAIFENEFAYESWRRGDAGWLANINAPDGPWMLLGGYGSQAYGAIYGITTGAKNAISDAYSEIDGIKGLTETSDEEIVAGYEVLNEAIQIYNAWKADDIGRATKSGVSALIKKYHNQLVFDFAPDGTSVADLYNAILAVPEVKEIQLYGNRTSTEDIVDLNGKSLWYVEGDEDILDDNKNPTGLKTQMYCEAEVKLIGSPVFVPVDAEGYWIKGEAIVASRDAKKSGVTYKAIYESIKFNLADLIKVTAADCVGKDLDHYHDFTKSVEDECIYTWTGGGAHVYGIEYYKDGTKDADGKIINDYNWDCDPVLLSDAMTLAEGYLAGAYDAANVAAIFNKLDDTAIVRDGEKAEGATPEWALVYRYLQYALEDKYTEKEPPAAPGSHKSKKDIRDLIEAATELVDETGDAAIFRASNVALDEAIKVAYDWLGKAATDKMYRDGATVIAADGQAYPNSDLAWEKLNGFYTQLQKEEAALKYEFGDIYEDIARICEDMDNGDLEPTEELIAAVDECAYALASVDPITYVTEGGKVCPDGKYYDNAAFTDVKDFVEINRCVTAVSDNDKDVHIYIAELDGELTSANSSHLALAKAYEAMLKAEKDQTAAPAVAAGDADGDGEVTAIDAGLILQYAAKMITLEDLKGNGDADEDGTVTALDAAKILVDRANA